MLNWLHQLSKWIEKTADHHQHTISLLESVSTTAAVIVALQASASARRAGRPRLTATATEQVVFYTGAGIEQDRPHYLAITITNVGGVSARIKMNFFSWSYPFRKRAWLVLPIDYEGDEHISTRSYPVELAPNSSEMFFLCTMSRFSEEIARVLTVGPLGSKTSRWLLKGQVLADGGNRFPVDISALRKSFKISLTSSEESS